MGVAAAADAVSSVASWGKDPADGELWPAMVSTLMRRVGCWASLGSASLLLGARACGGQTWFAVAVEAAAVAVVAVVAVTQGAVAAYVWRAATAGEAAFAESARPNAETARTLGAVAVSAFRLLNACLGVVPLVA